MSSYIFHRSASIKEDLMQLRLLFLLVAITVLLSVSAASLGSSDSASHASAKTSRLYSAGSIGAGSYRSPGKLHKVLIANNDSEALARAKAQAAVQIADYGSFRLLVMDEAAIQNAEEQTSRGEEERRDDVSIASAPLRLGSSASLVRDDLNLLILRSGAIDTTDESTTGTFVGMGRSAASYGLQSLVSFTSESAGGSQFRLIQFVGPVKRAWIEQLEASGFEPVGYVPNNGYLVRGNANSRDRLKARNQIAQASGEGFLQWEGPFLDEQKIHPALAAIAGQSGEVTVALQLALGKAEQNARNNPEVRQAKKLASAVMVDAYSVLNFTNVRMRIDASRIRDLAALPSVVNIEPWNPPQLF